MITRTQSVISERSIRMILLLAALFAGMRTTAAQTRVQLVDLVKLPDQMERFETDLLLRGSWYIEFHESWQVLPETRSILKEVTGYFPRNENAAGDPADSIRAGFASLISRMKGEGGTIRIREISYEFVLLDPHVAGSGNMGFSEPDSMDRLTRELQGILIDLVKATKDPGSMYDLPSEMLSLYFHEDWTIDPLTLQVEKKVTGITPVIWQRRQTVEGQPVNEFETGYPVYYKNPLSRIDLRNP